MYIADLHIHSKYSRATSRDCDAPHLDFWARQKGIGLVGTGDFTHPAWRQELRDCMEPAEDGLYRLKDEQVLPCGVPAPAPRFVVSGEISTIYKRDGKTRKVHHVILLPSLDAADDLSHRLEAVGNLHSDGRPILGLDSRDLLDIVLTACPDAIYIPAHIWTPHFSVFGAFSDFSTLEECYGDMTPYIHALETGLSSDPPMNRRLSMLDGYQLVSNSDAHSPAKLGREANLLTGPLSYSGLKQAVETGDGLDGTIEFYPEEGKYHLDGHRNCHCCLEPAETIRLDGRCPVCGRKLTVGVLHRVEALADRPEPIPLPKPFESLMPLPELLADCMGVSAASKKVQAAYENLLNVLGPELPILRTLPLDELTARAGPVVAEAVRRLRTGKVIRRAGFDGEYGVISLFEPGEVQMLEGQTSLIGLAGLATQKRFDLSGVKNVRSTAKTAETPPPVRFNREQEAAIHTRAACTAVIAGPGTGKTKTLVARVEALIDGGALPGEITAVTFTRQAAQEMRERLTALLGKKAARAVNVGTFHALCLNLIDQKPLVSQQQATEILSTLLEEHGEALSPVDCRKWLSLYKNNGCAATAETAGLPPWLVEAYARRLKLLGLRDLDDVLLDALAVDVRKKRAFTHLLVDEFQDINPVQHQLVRHWSQHGQTLFVIGDPDQSIYGFRGADARCFDQLLGERPDAQVIRLKENYRSTPQVLQCALAAIQPNPGRERMLRANRPDGPAIRLMQAADPFSEGVWIAHEIARLAGGMDMLDAQHMEGEHSRSFSEMAVLCRTHRQLGQVEACLSHDSIPCQIYGRSDWLENAQVQGLLGFFESLRDENNASALHAALQGLWRLPGALCQRAAVALAALPASGVEAFQAELCDFALLSPWADAVKACLPLWAKEKPRKLLSGLAERCGLSGRSVDELLNTAVFYPTMGELLDALLMGEEGDIRRQNGVSYASGAVRLMTLHGAKGLEFPVVFLCGVNAGTLPMEKGDEQEERRLFFVGVTRARDELILSCGGTPSPFLQHLPVRRGDIRTVGRVPQRVEQLTLF